MFRSTFSKWSTLLLVAVWACRSMAQMDEGQFCSLVQHCGGGTLGHQLTVTITVTEGILGRETSTQSSATTSVGSLLDRDPAVHPSAGKPTTNSHGIVSVVDGQLGDQLHGIRLPSKKRDDPHPEPAGPIECMDGEVLVEAPPVTLSDCQPPQADYEINQCNGPRPANTEIDQCTHFCADRYKKAIAAANAEKAAAQGMHIRLSAREKTMENAHTSFLKQEAAFTREKQMLERQRGEIVRTQAELEEARKANLVFEETLVKMRQEIAAERADLQSRKDDHQAEQERQRSKLQAETENALKTALATERNAAADRQAACEARAQRIELRMNSIEKQSREQTTVLQQQVKDTQQSLAAAESKHNLVTERNSRLDSSIQQLQRQRDELEKERAGNHAALDQGRAERRQVQLSLARLEGENKDLQERISRANEKVKEEFRKIAEERNTLEGSRMDFERKQERFWSMADAWAEVG